MDGQLSDGAMQNDIDALLALVRGLLVEQTEGLVADGRRRIVAKKRALPVIGQDHLPGQITAEIEAANIAHRSDRLAIAKCVVRTHGDHGIDPVEATAIDEGETVLEVSAVV